MKCCINRKCPDRYVGGTVWDTFCPRCGEKLYDVASPEAKMLIEEGWFDGT